MIDVHDTSDQREIGQVIPDGTFVHLKLALRAGGVSFAFDPQQAQADQGLFYRGRSWREGDATLIDCEFTILDGPYARQKCWQMYTVAGGELEASGVSKGWNITKRQLCGIINSAYGLDPKDESPQTRAYRAFPNFRALDGIEFWARLGIQEGNEIPGQPGEFYSDKNVIAHIVEANDPEYAPLRQGQQVEPQPRGARKGRRANANSNAGSGVASAGAAWAQGSHAVPAAPTPQQNLPLGGQLQPWAGNGAAAQPPANAAPPQPATQQTWPGAQQQPSGAQQPQAGSSADAPSWLHR